MSRYGEHSSSIHTHRFSFVFAGLLVLFGFVLIRLFYLQVIRGKTYRTLAAAQHFSELSIPAARGDILASDGSPLVINQPSYMVYAQPKLINAPAEFISRVSEVLPIDTDAIRDGLMDARRIWLLLGRKVSQEKLDALSGLGLTGLGWETEPKRFYPEASTAAHLLGFVGSDEDGNDKGYFGLEGYYNHELEGVDGMLRQERDVNGAPIVIGNYEKADAVDGQTLVLWVDRAVQRIVEGHLKDGIRRYGAIEGTVTVMDPKTGGILAMASYPSYDPDSYADYDTGLFKNPVVSASYEPGSTFKVLVMAAGINEKVVTPSTQMNETGPVRIGEYSIKTWNDTYRGTVSMTDVLVHSSNVGMVFVGQKLGKDRLLDYIDGFGFGQTTGIDLQEETTPSIRSENDWYEIDLATATFGQGIAVTPIQMVRAVSAIANGGWLLEPKIVKEIRTAKGDTVPVKTRKVRQVISENTARLVTEMMVASVDEGESKWTKAKGYRIAGKTGTAQIPVAGHYDDKKTIASFVGFAPAEDARFVILVTLREPTSSQWGSETAAPLFFNIASDLFSYYGIAPSS